jgi:hypothetical protein
MDETQQFESGNLAQTLQLKNFYSRDFVIFSFGEETFVGSQSRPFWQ